MESASWNGPRIVLSPADALARVQAHVPRLSEDHAQALALVELAGRGRDQVAEELGMAREELAGTLWRSRRELRRTLVALPGQGWCERAERLLSDRLDGALTPAGERRLEAHLAGCERCGRHELALGEARDRLCAAPVALLPTRVAPAVALGLPERRPRGVVHLRLVEPAKRIPIELGPATKPAPAILPRSRGARAAGGAWHAMFALAVLLAVAALLIAVAGATGMLERI